MPDNRQLAQYNLGVEKITGLLLSDKLNVLYVNTDSKIVQVGDVTELADLLALNEAQNQ